MNMGSYQGDVRCIKKDKHVLRRFDNIIPIFDVIYANITEKNGFVYVVQN